MSELRELVVELDRYWYYGRQDAVAQQMAKIREYLATSKSAPVEITGTPVAAD